MPDSTSLIEIAERLPDLTAAWPEPEPLAGPDSAPMPFPMGALGPMEAVARDIQKSVKCPPALAGASVLSVASLAAQGCYDVAFRGQDKRPLSLFILTIGRSGERKSTADQYAMIGVHRFIKELRGKAARDRQANELIEGEPFPVLSPEIVANNGTIEGLTQGFLEGHPSQALMSDEAGQFLAGYSMKSENKLSGLSSLSKFWDGSPVTKKIKGAGLNSETRTVRDCRLAVHMLGQRVAIIPFLRDPMARGQGSLARFLVHEPPTTMGTRQMTVDEWSESATTRNVMAFADRIEEILDHSIARRIEGDVERPVLQMEAAAVELLVQFFNNIERKLSPTGDLSGYSDLANKAHENAARIAGVLAVMKDEQVVSEASMRGGIGLANYFLAELIRLSDLLPAHEDVDKANSIAHFLKKEGGSSNTTQLSKRGSKSCRTHDQRKDAIKILVDADWIREDGKKLILNPRLGERGDWGEKSPKPLKSRKNTFAPIEANAGAKTTTEHFSPQHSPEKCERKTQ
ncbi:MAG: YfjI family protein [Pseudomonadota bacterium]